MAIQDLEVEEKTKTGRVWEGKRRWRVKDMFLSWVKKIIVWVFWNVVWSECVVSGLCFVNFCSINFCRLFFMGIFCFDKKKKESLIHGKWKGKNGTGNRIWVCCVSLRLQRHCIAVIYVIWNHPTIAVWCRCGHCHIRNLEHCIEHIIDEPLLAIFSVDSNCASSFYLLR